MTNWRKHSKIQHYLKIPNTSFVSLFILFYNYECSHNPVTIRPYNLICLYVLKPDHLFSWLFPSLFSSAVCDCKSNSTPKWVSCNGKVLERLKSRWKQRPEDAIWDMHVYWDLHTGSSGVDSWIRCTLLYRGQGGNFLQWGKETKTVCLLC